MKLVDRYLLREYLVPVGYCLTAFSALFVVYDLFAHIARFLKAGTPAVLVFRYYLCILSQTLEYIMPASLMLATLYCLWHLTRQNELIAMRTSGLSIQRIMLPFLSVALVCALITAAVKEHVTPPAMQWATLFARNQFRQVEYAPARDRAYYNAARHRMWIIDEYDAKAPCRLVGVKVTTERPDGSRSEEITASRAEWLDGQWWFHDVAIQRFDVNDQPMPRADPSAAAAYSVREMRELTERPSDFVGELKPWEFLTTREMWQYLKARRTLSAEARAQKLFDIHFNLATPWACLVVALFGIPAGARSSRQGFLGSVLMAVAFFLGFYALHQIGLFLGKRNIIWPWLGAWLSNIFFLAVGIRMLATMR